MSATNFFRSLNFTLLSEGGFSNDPHDPGGATMDGVTLAEFQTFTGNWGATSSDLRAITQGQIQQIYQDNYWSVVLGDELPAGVDLSVFDMAVNAGPPRSVKILQSIVGTTQDGVLGPLTLRAIVKTSPLAIIAKLYTRQLAFYQSLPTFQYFGKGWTARTAARRQAAIAFFGTLPVTGAHGKAMV